MNNIEQEFNKERLRKRLLKLSTWKQLAFTISCCERMLSNYLMFAKDTHWGNEEILRSALNEGWACMDEGTIRKDLSLFEKKCMKVTPDSENFQSLYTSSAMDASNSIGILMSLFTHFDLDGVIEVASLIRDSIDMYVQETENISPQMHDREEKIIAHPLMQNELYRQNQDLEILESLNENMVQSMPHLKRKWFATKKSCLGLSI